MTNIIKFNAYHFEQSETAQKLKNSKGSEKSRLHLLNYEGLAGKDRYAVAAEIIRFKDGEERKLGWWDRMFNVLHKHDNGDGTSTWYKINKNSLEKRLGISSEKLGLDEDTGVVGKELEELVEAKQKNIDELTKLARNPQDDFQKRLIRGLAEAGITKEYYDAIIMDPDGELKMTDDVKKGWEKRPQNSVLWITYSANEGQYINLDPNVRSFGINSPIVQLWIGPDAYNEILSGKPIPENLIGRLNLPLGLPLGKIQFPDQGKEYTFHPKTRTIDLVNILKEIQNAVGPETEVMVVARIDNKESGFALKIKDVDVPDLLEEIANAQKM